ncbi:MAG: crosslink repair DNA glycosylase YcaQ family protein [Bryobacteraceae bacterium]
MSEITLAQARRIALAALGFDRARPRRSPNARDLASVIRRLGLIQIDYVNVLVPAHYQVPFSRLGPYDRSAFDDLVYRTRQFTEQWAHEASIVPVDTWPLLRHRMERHRPRPWGFEEFLDANPGYADWVLQEVRARGPLVANELQYGEIPAQRIPGAWYSSVSRATLETHFGRGILAVANRRPDFARIYDLTERVLPAEHHGRQIGHEEAQRTLLGQAGKALGIATEDDLADYYRMPIKEARPRIVELVEEGILRPVKVEGWRAAAYLHCDAALPRSIVAASLLSPFDPVVWYRRRAARLFDFEYRIEIFVPQPQRRWGYYVLPFLLGDHLVARVDLKADRGAKRLLVPAAYIEDGFDAGYVAEALAKELRIMAGWLGLDSVSVGKRAGFGRVLARALK